MKKTTADKRSSEYYIQFLNKDKGFKEDVKDFNSYPDAHSWGKDNIENFTLDQIKWRRSSEV